AKREAAHPGELICCLPDWQPDALPVTLVYAYGQQPRKVSALLNMLRDATPCDWQGGYAASPSPVPNTSTVAPTLLHQH
ncbi:MAG: hypothetical protein ACQEQ6_04100, partial [Pseudomonadota bacterium]